MSAIHAAGALPRGAVLADVIPGARVRDAVLVVSGALLTALFAQISIKVRRRRCRSRARRSPSAWSARRSGMRRGAASLGLYAVLGLFLPFYADGDSGWDVIWGASGGYMIGFIFAAGFVGWMAEHGADRSPLRAFRRLRRRSADHLRVRLVGLKIAVGESWGWTIHNGFTIFIVGGLVKAAIGAVVLPGTWRLVRRFER